MVRWMDAYKAALKMCNLMCLGLSLLPANHTSTLGRGLYGLLTSNRCYVADTAKLTGSRIYNSLKYLDINNRSWESVSLIKRSRLARGGKNRVKTGGVVPLVT
ncbi:hypothetical protein B0H12DRAFT_707254 [Mycena haematopus]|nr:hypothetical protein B0H12DRAFT_707254 [Mycena haematopus]